MTRERLTLDNPPKKKRSIKLSAKQRAKRFALAERRRQVRDFIVKGVSQLEIARRLGVSQPTVYMDIKYIQEEMLREDTTDAREVVALRVKQLEHLMFEALNSFYLSQEPKYKRIKPLTVKDEDGTEVEVIPRKLPGNGSFLKEARESLREIAKLLGLYPRGSQIIEQQNIQNTQINTTAPVQVDWQKISADDLLQIRRIYSSALLQKSNSNGSGNGNGDGSLLIESP
jgi:DNA-binding CsgD family transcriptional regulator